MEDLFYTSSNQILIEDIEKVIKELYPLTKLKRYEGLYVDLKAYCSTYWEYYYLPQDEMEGIKIEEPEFWQKENPKQVIVITHKRNSFLLLKPVLKRIMELNGGKIFIFSDNLYSVSTIDNFNY